MCGGGYAPPTAAKLFPGYAWRMKGEWVTTTEYET
jgi:hypothetical protein